MSKVTVFDHPLIQHKLSILRDEKTPTKEFRELISEISMLMCYEATRDLPLEDVEIKTPMAPMVAKKIAGRKLAFIPILRAGMGMLDAMLTMVPSAKVGHIGLYRDEETHKPVEYYNKLPGDIDERDVFVLDPMLATGGSAIDAIDIIKRSKPRSIKFLCIIAAPEGIKALTEAHPDIDLFCAAQDEKLNPNCYIIPGLGDAGDRIYGTDVVGEVSVDKRGSTVKLHSKTK
ncbi:MAG: uracil phosphoribosyltransferase [Ruminococcus sp.]|nr:uracil phosphoribosyltransferase [Ruminococcus sp.]